MKFDESNVINAMHTDRAVIGSKGYFSDDIVDLKTSRRRRQKAHYFPIDVVCWDSSYDLGEYEVNAWMPLPQPPKEVE